MAGELCLECLKDCITLRPEVIRSALSEIAFSPEMLERGLMCIDKGLDAAPYGIMPELRFHLANYWLHLYELTNTKIHLGSPSMPALFPEPIRPPISSIEYRYFPGISIFNPSASGAAITPNVPSFLWPVRHPFYPVFPGQPPSHHQQV